MHPHPAALESLLTQLDASIANADTKAARGLCSSEGWEHSEYGLSDFVRQAIRKGLRLDSLGEAHLQDSRSLIEADLRRQDRPDSLGIVRLLAQEDQGDWKLEGITKESSVAAAFLTNGRQALVPWESLPPSPRARTWAEALIARVHEENEDILDAWPEYAPEGIQDLLRNLYSRHHQNGLMLRVIESRHVPHSRRHSVGIEGLEKDAEPEEWYLTLEEGSAPDTFRPIEAVAFPSVARMLDQTIG